MPSAGPHSARKGDQIDPAVVAIRRDEPQSLFDALDGGTPLARLCVMDPDAELQKDADEIGFVAHAFEEEIFKAVAGFEIFAGVEQIDTANEPWIVSDLNNRD